MNSHLGMMRTRHDICSVILGMGPREHKEYEIVRYFKAPTSTVQPSWAWMHLHFCNATCRFIVGKEEATRFTACSGI